MAATLSPVEILNAYTRRYPQAWAQMEHFRLGKGGFADWPDWCWVPVAGAYAVVSGGGSNTVPPDRLHDVGVVHALAAWRLSQCVYRFDPELYDRIAETPMSAEVPVEALLRLPEWCVYIETNPEAEGILGFWACLESDQNDGHTELRISMHFADGKVFCLPLHLVPGGTMKDCLDDTMRYTADMAALFWDKPATPEARQSLMAEGEKATGLMSRLVNLVLYLCADSPDIDGKKPEKAAPVKTKRGPRWFPAQKQTVHEVGYRISRWMREARASAERTAGTDESGRQITPHIRRAHWHGFWSGKKSEPETRKFGVRWLPPTPVGFSAEDVEKIIPAVKIVK